MKIERTCDVKKYIIVNFHNIPEDRFDIVKVGRRVYIYLVTADCKLKREVISNMQLSLVNKQDYLLQYLRKSIEQVLKKYNYL